MLGIMANEHSKQGTVRREPAKFRETALDTHKASPAEDWGPSPDLLPAGYAPPPDYLTMLKTQRMARKSARSLPHLAGSMHGVVPPEQVQHASVFVPRPDQAHACATARTHREKVANSEWALLDTLEVELYNNEKAWREKMKEQTAAEQRACLDRQVQERKLQEEAARQERLNDALLVNTQIERDAAAKAVKERELAVKNAQLRRDRLSDMAAAQAARDDAVESKRREEAAMLSDIKVRLEQEKVLAAERLEQVRRQAAQAKLDNERRIQAKSAALQMQRQADDAMIKDGIRLAEETDRRRQEERAQFKAMIEARMKGAGQKALDDKRVMIEREERLMRDRMEKMELEEQAKERARADKKDAHKRMLQESRALCVAAKERDAAVAKMETLAMKEMLDARMRAEQEAEDRKMAALRARAKDNQEFLRAQAEGVEARTAEEFVGMSSAERQLNRRLLKQAQKMVGPTPKQLTANW